VGVIVAVPDAAISTLLSNMYSDGAVERLVICPERRIPSGKAHLGGISQPLNMNALIPVASVPGSTPAMSATIIDAHGRPTR
jgi:hypothetical protein